MDAGRDPEECNYTASSTSLRHLGAVIGHIASANQGLGFICTLRLSFMTKACRYIEGATDESWNKTVCEQGTGLGARGITG